MGEHPDVEVVVATVLEAAAAEMAEPADEGAIFLRAVSRLIGWIYILCWSLSFYPQPLLNWRRRSTKGLAIDFPFLNVLGFAAYTISTASFLYSPTIREQYAFRHPTSPETTVRFNDFVFALHGAVLCVVTYSQFFPGIWGLEVGSRQRASRFVLGIFWGCLISVTAVAVVVRTGRTSGYDPGEWAWIDLVRHMARTSRSSTLTLQDILHQLHQDYSDSHQVLSAGAHQLSTPVDRGLEHLADPPRLCRGSIVNTATRHRLVAPGRLVWDFGKPSQVSPRQCEHRVRCYLLHTALCVSHVLQIVAAVHTDRIRLYSAPREAKPAWLDRASRHERSRSVM
jgi:uncharacterized protein with PQ loop repeat